MNFGNNNHPKTVGGGFGKFQVYYSKKFGKKVVEKQISEQPLEQMKKMGMGMTELFKEKDSLENMLRKEKDLMMQLKEIHLDCCVEILDFKDNPPRIIMEYYEGGDLRKLLDDVKVEVDVRGKVEMIGQILDAIKWIHEDGFIHGDLKCQNIFLVNKYIPGDIGNIKIKLGNFGLSQKGGKLILGGTPGYQAP